MNSNITIVSEKIVSEINQQQSEVTYKVKYNEELRRFSLPSSATWETVVGKIGTLFSLNVDSIVVKYEDDEKELVTIDSDSELQEAVRVFLTQSQDSNLILRLAIFDVPQQSKFQHHHQHQFNNFHRHHQAYHHQHHHQFNQNHDSPKCEWKKWSQQKKCDSGEWKEKREKFRAALIQLEDKGFKCKGKNIRALKQCDFDVDKAAEYLIKENPKCEKFKTDLAKLQEMGFENKWTNCFVLKRMGGDIDKAVSILSQARVLQEKGCDNHHFAARLLVKCDGDASKVEEIWNKKREKYLAKRQKCMDRKLKKCDWKRNKKNMCKNKKEWKERKHCSNYCGEKKMMKCEKESC